MRHYGGRTEKISTCLLYTSSHDYPDCYLVLVHTRLPKLDYNDEGLAHLCRLNALDESSCYALFDALLKRQAVETPDQSQVKEIASYLEGYPPSIYNAVKACSLEGVDLVCSDKRALLDFQERIFKDFLDKLPFSDAEWNVLTALYNTVSYTHLDVYKRQLSTLSPFSSK